MRIWGHITYWVLQFLGRSITANKQKATELTGGFLKAVSNPNIYNSVVVRRQIFWELYRITKVIPPLATKFTNVFEDGLTDVNPDVELLATLCFGLLNKVQKLNDPEDDVRETVLRIVRNLHHVDYVIENKEKLFKSPNYSNYHVHHEAELIKEYVEELLI